MRRAAFLVATLALLTGCGDDDESTEPTPGSIRYDQVFDPFTPTTWSLRITANEPLGQQFTPAATRLTFVDLRIRDEEDGGLADVSVNVREGAVDGTILATSDPVVAAGLTEPTRFEVDLMLVPGETYVIEPVTMNETLRIYGNLDGAYDGGSAISSGNISTGDLWFRTGYVVE